MFMTTQQLREVIAILRKEYNRWDAPAKKFIGGYERTPYAILITTVLSWRTKDEVTLKAAKRLLAIADRPQMMVNVSRETIERAIYPVGFYRQKAKTVLSVSKELVERFSADVPKSLEELTSIKGVGLKTAKIVLESAFGKPYVAVDTHVHRLCNLWGVVHTKTPQETDRVLEELLEDSDKRGLNRLLVSFGQSICKPRSPVCGKCPLKERLQAFGVFCSKS